MDRFPLWKCNFQDAERIEMKASEVKMTGHGWSHCWHRIKTTVSFAAEYLLTNGLFLQRPIVWMSKLHSIIYYYKLPYYNDVPCFSYIFLYFWFVYATANELKKCRLDWANFIFDGQASPDVTMKSKGSISTKNSIRYVSPSSRNDRKMKQTNSVTKFYF